MLLPSPSRLLWIALLTLGLGSGCGQRILDEDGGTDREDAGLDGGADAGQEPIAEVTIRVMAANTTNGPAQKYDAAGTRIFQGLKPDVVLIQEFTLDTTLGTTDAWVDSTFGTEFHWYREPIESGENIPNGVISRWEILDAGQWTQPTSPGAGETRDFVWAQINIPGPIDLWVVSVHLATTDGDRPNEASVLLGHLQDVIPAGGYLIVGGDLNTDSRTETAINTLSAVVDTAGPFPVDQAGDGDTNLSRAAPYDWVLAEADLRALETPVVIGANSFPNGLVFDCRVYSPLADVAPVLSTDCDSLQHMAVVRDFLIPY